MDGRDRSNSNNSIIGDEKVTSNDHGLGLYPSDPCFDPNRPSLLPYWIDDATESNCFYGGGSILGDVIPAAGYMATTAIGGAAQGVAMGLANSSWALAAIAVALILFMDMKK